MIKFCNSLEELSNRIMTEYYFKDPKDGWVEKFRFGMTLIESVKEFHLKDIEKIELANLYSFDFYKIDQVKLFQLLNKAFKKAIIIQEELDI